MVLLKDGTTETTDRRLDRIPFHDPRSRAFGVADVLPSRSVKPRVWDLRWRLNQGQQGACVLFGLTHNRVASPRPRRLAQNAQGLEAFAFAAYRRAQQLDEWPGEEPAYSGTSLLAGAKALQETGALGEYRWALGSSESSYIDDVLGALTHLGPVVFATSWLSGMMDTDRFGVLRVQGAEDGGHGYCIRGWHADARRVPHLRGSGVTGPVLVGTNSWSRSWGYDGNFYLPVEAQPDGSQGAEWLLAGGRSGECLVPLDRG